MLECQVERFLENFVGSPLGDSLDSDCGAKIGFYNGRSDGSGYGRISG